MCKVVSQKLLDKAGNKREIDFTFGMRLLYPYMLDRYMFFRSKGNLFFDNQQDLAINCGMSQRNVVDSIKKFVYVGLVEKSVQPQIGAIHSNSYIVHDVFNKDLFVPFCEKEHSVITTKVVNKKQRITTRAEQEDFEDMKAPF